MTLPNALIQNNIDLRSFEFMPLDVVRFRDSDFTALVDAEAFRSGFLLMCASWHQVPAGSLPNDDRILSNLAGFGRVVKEWEKFKDEALHGWVLCNDNRYYHPVVCEKALESWNSKQEYNYKKFADRLRKANGKLGDTEQIEIPSFDVWINNGMPDTWSNYSKSQKTEMKIPSNGPKEESPNHSQIIPQEGQNHSDGIPLENSLKGTEHNGQVRDIIKDINNHVHNSEESFSENNNSAVGEVDSSTQTKFSFKSALKKNGVPEKDAAEFLQVRKAKKAQNTENAFDALLNEAQKAGITLQQAVEYCLKRQNPWGAFKASWYLNEKPEMTTGQQSNHQSLPRNVNDQWGAPKQYEPVAHTAVEGELI